MGLDLLDLATLPALGLLCAVASVEDLRFGLIRNKWVAAGLLWGLAAYALLSLSRLWWPGLTDPAAANTLFDGSWPRLLGLTALNAACALACGFLIFHLDYWSAGDAKLFFAIALLLPLKYYFRHYLPVFPAFALFLNVIVLAALYVWIESAWGIFRSVKANPERDLLREIRDSAAVQFRGALTLLLAAAFAFISAMFVNARFGLSGGAATALNLALMAALLLGGGALGRALENRGARLALYAAAAALFAFALASPLRLQALKMGLTMSLIFSVIFFLTSVLPVLTEKFGVQREEMPFALFLALGAALTLALKGSPVFLLVL